MVPRFPMTTEKPCCRSREERSRFPAMSVLFSPCFAIRFQIIPREYRLIRNAPRSKKPARRYQNTRFIPMSNRLTTVTDALRGRPDFQKVLDTILEAFGCQTGTIHQWVDLHQMLEILASTGIPDDLRDKVERIPLGKGIAGVAAERMEPVQICNLQNDKSGVAKPAAKKTKVGGSVAVPIEFGGLLMGTLGIGKHEPYDFTSAELADLQIIAAAIADKWADG